MEPLSSGSTLGGTSITTLGYAILSCFNCALVAASAHSSMAHLHDSIRGTFISLRALVWPVEFDWLCQKVGNKVPQVLSHVPRLQLLWHVRDTVVDATDRLGRFWQCLFLPRLGRAGNSFSLRIGIGSLVPLALSTRGSRRICRGSSYHRRRSQAGGVQC